ncbi:DUF4328 domain-containing protein [Akkermansiaceae bacterium]|nr:DUF4328 domain-containing protein [bacterium]MDB4377731.1 DUF4328 domain-containing protein [Akkermansiaceae bacterium]
MELETLNQVDYDYEGEEYSLIEKADLAIGGLSGVVSVSLIVLWCVWTNKSCKNSWLINSRDGATALDRGRDSYSPGWAVGWHFIPIAMLWKPYQAMAWIRDASQKSLGLTMGKLLGLWWTFWILSSLSDRAVTKMFTKAATVEEIEAAHRVLIAISPLDLLSTIFATLIVHRLTKIQKARGTELGLRAH